MIAPPLRLDKRTLASFLAGTLSERHREAVIVHLTRNDRDRMLLVMAVEALDAARTMLPPKHSTGRAA